MDMFVVRALSSGWDVCIQHAVMTNFNLVMTSRGETLKKTLVEYKIKQMSPVIKLNRLWYDL